MSRQSTSRTYTRAGLPRSRKCALALAVAGTICVTRPAVAVDFSDATMDPAGYQVTSYVMGGSVAVSASASGNPGAAMQVLVTVPSPSSVDRTAVYLLNPGFVWEPASSSQPMKFSFTLDKLVSFNPASSQWGNGQGFIARQGDRLYEVDAGLTAVDGVYQTASVTATLLLSFNWLSDPAQRIVDATVHPTASGGPLTFGFYIGIGVPVGYPSETVTYRVDNFGVSIQPVPEPSTAVLWLAALSIMWPMWHRRGAPCISTDAS